MKREKYQCDKCGLIMNLAKPQEFCCCGGKLNSVQAVNETANAIDELFRKIGLGDLSK